MLYVGTLKYAVCISESVMSHLTHNWNSSTTSLPFQHGRIQDSHQDNLKMMHDLFI